MTPLRIIFLFFSYTFVQRACKPIVMFCQHCPFSARLLLTEVWGAMAQPPLWCPVCFPGSMLQLWVCPLLRLHVKFVHPSARHSFPLDLSQFRRTEMWLRGVIQPVVERFCTGESPSQDWHHGWSHPWHQLQMWLPGYAATLSSWSLQSPPFLSIIWQTSYSLKMLICHF